MGAITSYFKALKASRLFGSALKQERKGNISNALQKANEGLKVLSQPGVIRSNPAESSVLVNLTIFVENLAPEMNQAGANEKDLCDTYIFIKELEDTDLYMKYNEWLTYIENKLGYVPSN